MTNKEYNELKKKIIAEGDVDDKENPIHRVIAGLNESVVEIQNISAEMERLVKEAEKAAHEYRMTVEEWEEHYCKPIEDLVWNIEKRLADSLQKGQI